MNNYPPQSAAHDGFALCHSCGLVSPVEDRRCPRCGASLHLRRRESLQRTWALTLAAFILYFPANMLPMLRVDSFAGTQENTIIGGVVQFWRDADYPVAIIIFVASVVIPVLKLIAIITLCLATRFGRWPIAMTKLYRMTEFIGRWSMVDVFVVAILVGVVQLGSVISIHAGAAAVSFAAVVILTMLAATSFDPRLIWDAAERRSHPPSHA
ncbi:MAG TPA: paraquat-inducible protein A [Chthoniobacterales bacterium]